MKHKGSTAEKVPMEGRRGIVGGGPTMKGNAKGDYRGPTGSARVRFLFIYWSMTEEQAWHGQATPVKRVTNDR